MNLKTIITEPTKQIATFIFHYSSCHCKIKSTSATYYNRLCEWLNIRSSVCTCPRRRGTQWLPAHAASPEGTTRVWQQRPFGDNVIVEIIYVHDPSSVLYFALRPQLWGHLHAPALAFSHSWIKCLPTSLEAVRALHSESCGNWHLEIN